MCDETLILASGMLQRHPIGGTCPRHAVVHRLRLCSSFQVPSLHLPTPYLLTLIVLYGLSFDDFSDGETMHSHCGQECSMLADTTPPLDSAAKPPPLLVFVEEVRSFYEKLFRQQNFVGRLNPEDWTTLIVPSVVGKGLVINHHEKLVRQTRARLPFIILIYALCLHTMKDLSRNRGTFRLWSKVISPKMFTRRGGGGFPL
jgi:hypothetical protein